MSPSKATGRLSTNDATVDVNGFRYAANTEKQSRLERYTGKRVVRVYHGFIAESPT